MDRSSCSQLGPTLYNTALADPRGTQITPHTQSPGLQIMDMPLPPPASYNQGYTPGDGCHRQRLMHQQQTDLQLNDHRINTNGVQTNNKSTTRHLKQLDERGYGGFPHLFQARPQHSESFKQPADPNNRQNFQNSMPVNNVKFNKSSVFDRSYESQSITATLPRSVLSYDVQQSINGPLLDRQSNGHLVRSNGVSMSPPCQLMHQTPAQLLHFGTLGRARTRSGEPGLKLKRDLRASASDLTDRSKVINVNGKNESVV